MTQEYKIIIDCFGNKQYYKLGTDILHREDGPAVEYKDGGYCYFFNGKIHRHDGPALKLDGREFWYFQGISYISEAEFIKKTNK